MDGQVRLSPLSLLAQLANSLAQADTNISCHSAIMAVFFRLHFAYRIQSWSPMARWPARVDAGQQPCRRSIVRNRLLATGWVLLAASLSVGCHKQQPAAKSIIDQALTGTPNAQRFVVVNNSTMPVGFLALDTQTGRLCKTWDWGLQDSSPLKGTGLDALTTCRQMLSDDDVWLATWRYQHR